MDKNVGKLLQILQINYNLEVFKDTKLFKVKYEKIENYGEFYFYIESKSWVIYETLRIASLENNKRFFFHFSLFPKTVESDLLTEKILRKIILETIQTINPNLFLLENNIVINIEKQNIFINTYSHDELIKLRTIENNLLKLLKLYSLKYNLMIKFIDLTEKKTVSIEKNEKIINKNNYDNDVLQLKNINDFYTNTQLTTKTIFQVKGKIFDKKFKKTKTKKTGKDFYILNYLITDYYNSLIATNYFFTEWQAKKFSKYEKGEWVEIVGTKTYNNYSKNFEVKIQKIFKITDLDKQELYDLKDNAKEKRVELHTHSFMSGMDGASDITEYIKNAAYEKKHNAIAITELYNCQSFVKAYNYLKEHRNNLKNFKLIYGVEFNLFTKKNKIIENANLNSLFDKIICFDLETTGLYPLFNEIIEFGGCKINNIDDSIESSNILQIFIKSKKNIPEHIQKLTNIDDEILLKHGEKLKEVLINIKQYFSGCILYAHNASFDITFLNVFLKKMNLEPLTESYVDTVNLSRFLFPNFKSHSLKALAKKFKIKYDSDTAHRADYDSKILAQILKKLLNELKLKYPEVKTAIELKLLIDNHLKSKDPYLLKYEMGNNVLVIAKNQSGLKDLYKLVTTSCTKNFFKLPRLSWDDIDSKRENLIIIAPGMYSNIHENLLNGQFDDFQENLKKYDFVEINPPANYIHLLEDKKIDSNDDIKFLIKEMISLTLKNNVIPYASGNAFYVYKNQKIVRDIFINSKAIGNKRHYLYSKNIKKINPDHHFRTTNELLKEFSFIENKLAKKLIVYNTIYISSLISNKIIPVLEEMHKPEIDNSKELLENILQTKIKHRYGEQIPEFIQSRITRELESIIKNEFYIVYWVASLVVKKSMDEGYIVGSRGSVGSSIIANLIDITDVNPLQPHYNCINCKYTQKTADDFNESGFDLPTIKCPKCNSKMNGNGHNIPFETFLGFDGEKYPDIDLNFSADYQMKAHEYVRKMFGYNYVFRAGTINTVQFKTAYGYVKSFLEEHKIEKSNAEINRLCLMCEGSKRTTGQHPGGLIIVPRKLSIFDFTPYNYPAHEKESNWFTTHYDFNSLHDNLLKLDILGHQDPKALKYLRDLTNIDISSIPFNDKNILKMFSDISVLNLKKEDLGTTTGTIGVPEFGTSFVISMLEDTKPKSFADLVRVCGLAHGTDVWLNNAKDLIKTKKLGLKDLITCRDDIMNYLIKQGISNKTAFLIMEDVRKGKGLKEKYFNELIKNNIDEWYIDCCRKIKYLFPKAHAVAYVIMAWKIAWFKYYYPLEYYSSYFTFRCTTFDYSLMMASIDEIKQKISMLELKNTTLTPKEAGLLATLKSVLEMKLRNITFADINLLLSDAELFLIDKTKKQLILPFKVIDGLGIETAESIVIERNKNHFSDLKDLQQRSKINKNHAKFFAKFF